MMLLRLAALVSALTTMTLNGHFGWSSADTLPYAVLLATLSVALDLAKCSLLWAAATAWRHKARLSAALFFLMFWPCLAYSLYAGVAQIAITRDAGKAGKLATAENRLSLEARYQRLTHDVDLAQASPTYAATAACTNATKTTSKAFCTNLAGLKTQLDDIARALAATPPVDPEPQLTLIAAITGWTMPALRFTVAIWPIVLAEMCGSLGFYLTSRLPATPAERSTHARKWFWQGWTIPARKRPSAARAAAAGDGLAPQPPAAGPTSPPSSGARTLTWSLPSS